MTLNPPAKKAPATAAIRKELAIRAEAIFALVIFILGVLVGHFL